jgi:hypothetical protein
MTLEEQKIAWKLIQNPPPGSKLAEAEKYGIDLTLLLENLKLSVTQRLDKLYSAALSLEELRNSSARQR